MASVTIDELFGRAQQFELRLEGFYADLRDHTENNGVKLLTYYLSRHRRHLERALASLDHEELERVRGVRLKVDIPFDPEASFALLDKPAREVNGGELLAAAVEHDERLARLYKAIGDQPVGEEAGRLVEGLVRLEEKDIVMLKKMIAMNYF